LRNHRTTKPEVSTALRRLVRTKDFDEASSERSKPREKVNACGVGQLLWPDAATPVPANVANTLLAPTPTVLIMRKVTLVATTLSPYAAEVICESIEIQILTMPEPPTLVIPDSVDPPEGQFAKSASGWQKLLPARLRKMIPSSMDGAVNAHCKSP